MITLTQSAVNEIADILKTENERWIRVSIKGGGCSGFNYVFDFADTKNDDDIELNDMVLIDSMSMMYLDNATISYNEDLMASRFHVDNPNAATTCGCGSSFGI